MDKALVVLNNMVGNEIIEDYAIGGGVALLFYTEPVLTYDLDVFCFMKSHGELVLSLSPIYEYLKKRGYKPEKEHINIGGIPIQFIPAYNKLVEEAVKNATRRSYKGVRTKVLRPEYLLAIMLQTGRPKDRTRILLLLDEAKIDKIRN